MIEGQLPELRVHVRAVLVVRWERVAHQIVDDLRVDLRLHDPLVRPPPPDLERART